MSHGALSLYLRDHYAGSVAGVALARRFAESNRGTLAGEALAAIAGEIEADRAALRSLMAECAIPDSPLKNATAWALERLERLKPNGRLGGEPLLQRVHELEALSLGIAGKQALWDALRAVPDFEPTRVDLDALAERARDQRARVEELRVELAREALSSATVGRPPRRPAA